jgi:hypothetical protein
VLVSGVEHHLAMQEMWKEWLQASVATPVSRVMSFRQIEQDIVCWRLGVLKSRAALASIFIARCSLQRYFVFFLIECL